MQFFPMNEEFPVSAGHKLALIKSLPFVHTARRYYRLDGLVRSSDRPRRGRRRPWRRSRKDDQTGLSRGSKSRNKVSVGEPAEGSLPSARAAETGARPERRVRPSDCQSRKTACHGAALGRQAEVRGTPPPRRDKVASQERRQQGRRARAPGRLRAGGIGERRERASGGSGPAPSEAALAGHPSLPPRNPRGRSRSSSPTPDLSAGGSAGACGAPVPGGWRDRARANGRAGTAVRRPGRRGSDGGKVVCGSPRGLSRRSFLIRPPPRDPGPAPVAPSHRSPRRLPHRAPARR